MGKCRKTAEFRFGQNAYKNNRVNWPAQGAAVAATLSKDNRPDARPLFSRFNLSDMHDVYRKVTRSPIGASLLLGGLGAGASYLSIPYIMKILQPGIPFEYIEQRAPDIRRNATILSGILAAAAPLAMNFSTKLPGYGLTSYTPKDSGIAKTESLFAQDVPTMTDAYRGVMLSDVKPAVKEKMFEMLDATQLPANAPVTRSTLIDSALNAGLSAVEAGSLGYLTASVLGLPDPKRAALTLGGIGGLASLIF